MKSTKEKKEREGFENWKIVKSLFHALLGYYVPSTLKKKKKKKHFHRPKIFCLSHVTDRVHFDAVLW